MATQRQTANDHGNSSAAVNPVVAGAVGAMVGATAALLIDSKNRQRVVEVVETAVKRAREGADDARRIASDALADLETKMNDARGEAVERAKEATKKAQKGVERGKQMAEKGAEEVAKKT